MLAPVGMAMLFRVFPPAERVRASAILIIPTTFAPALGPVLGGLLVTDLSWRWVFFVNVPIGVAALIFGALFLDQSAQAQPGRFDLAGFLLSGLGLGLLMYGVSEGPDLGWHRPDVLGDDRRGPGPAGGHGGRRAADARADGGPPAARRPPVPGRQRGHGPRVGGVPRHPVHDLAVLPGRPGPDRTRSGLSTFPEASASWSARSWPAGCCIRGSARRHITIGLTGRRCRSPCSP